MTKELSIIIVNWNSANYIRNCLSTIYSKTKGIAFEIIIVDNASFDGCAKIIKDEFQDVIYIQSDKNIGFAAANNLGYSVSCGNNLLFLNPDTELYNSAINIMLSYLKTLDQVGAVGCKLLNSDKSLQTSCVQAFPAILNQVLGAEFLRKLFPRLKLWGVETLYDGSTSPKAVDVVSGACIMIKREIFDKVGQFSTEYFMYSEDVDLCYKIKRLGLKTYFINESKVIHHSGGSTSNNKNMFHSTILRKHSRFIFFQKTKGKKYANIYRYTMSGVSMLRLILLISIFPVWKLSKKNKLSYSFKKWNTIFKWSIGIKHNLHSNFA